MFGRPEKDEVLLLIDSEIKSIRYEETRKGFTTWTIISGVSAIAWTLLGTFEGDVESIASVSTILLTMAMALETLNLAYRSVVPRDSTIGDGVRYRWSDEWPALKLKQSVLALRHMALFSIPIFFDTIGSQSFRISAVIFYSVIMGLVTIQFVQSHISNLLKIDGIVPFLYERHHWGARVLRLIMAGLGGYSSLGHITHTLLREKYEVLVDGQMAVLIFVAVVLFTKLSDSGARFAAIGKLENIRRSLIFNELETANTVHMIRIILEGMTRSDVDLYRVKEMAQEIKGVTHVGEIVEEDLRMIEVRLKKIHVKSQHGQATAKNKMAENETAILRSCENILRDAMNAHQFREKKIAKLRSRLMRLKSTDSSILMIISETRTRLGHESDKSVDQMNKLLRIGREVERLN